MANEEPETPRTPPIVPPGLPQPLRKTSEPFEIKFDDLPKFSNPGLPTVWVDNVMLVVRGTVDNMEGATLRFYTILPEAAIEAARFQTSIDHLKRMIDVFARTVDYYPQRPDPLGSPAPSAEDSKP